ncbi:MAG: hypothetical protein IKH30_16540 [Clostridia bacterium]|nr:hypothetical protein [Clostridia bacterium]
MFRNVRLAKVALFALCLALALCLSASAMATTIIEGTTTTTTTGTSTDVITETDHVWAYKTLIKDATCSDPPTYQYTCTICGAKKTVVEGTTNGQHVWGEWIVDSQATCTTAGARHRQCQLNVHHTETQTIAALGHELQWRITIPATCSSTGTREQYCTRCGQVINTEVIPQGSHVWGAWTIIRQPTCFDPGEQTHTCTLCGTVENAVYGAALGHNWGAWQVITPATCETSGTRTRVCLRDASHVENEIIPAPGHQWTAWRRVKEPTFWERGREERNCTVCGKVESRELETIIWNQAVMCSFGLRLKETNQYHNYSDRWYMFTPFDASLNGQQVYDLVVSDSLIVGEVTLNIRDGYLTVDYNLKGGDAIKVTLEFFTVLNRIGDLASFEPEGLMYMKLNRNQAINLAEQFPGDTHLVLYFCSRVSVQYHPAFKALQYRSVEHQTQLDQMYLVIDY